MITGNAMVHMVAQPSDNEVPEDLKAFFGHPLNSSFQNDDGALALLHEYKSLPAIDSKVRSNETSISPEQCEMQDTVTFDGALVDTQIHRSIDEYIFTSENDRNVCQTMSENVMRHSNTERLLPVASVTASSVTDENDNSCQEADDFEKLVKDAALMTSDVCSQQNPSDSFSKLVFKNQDLDSHEVDTDNILTDAFGDYNNEILDQLMKENVAESRTVVGSSSPTPAGIQAINEGEMSTDELLHNYINGHDTLPVLSTNNNTESQNLDAPPPLTHHSQREHDIGVDTSPIHHSSPKLEPVTPPQISCSSDAVANQSCINTTTAANIKSETLPALPKYTSLPPQNQIRPNMPPQTQQQVSQSTPTQPGMPVAYPMMPQFMPLQIVQTSSGPMQVQPFIHNGQFGITQVTPCRPQGAAVMQPRPPMGMTWGPQFYPYNMGARMMGPEAIRLPGPAMYCAPPEFYMMRPTFAMHAPVQVPVQATQQVAAVDGSTAIPVPPLQLAPPTRTTSSIPVCQQLRIQQQLHNHSNTSTTNSDTADTPSGTNRLPDTAKSKPTDTLQQACVLSNIKQQPAMQQPAGTQPAGNVAQSASALASHLKSPDSGFGESHASEVTPCSSESEVCLSNPGSPSSETTAPSVSGSSSAKKRRGSMCTYSRQCSTKATANNNANTINHIAYSKRLDDSTGYRMKLEAATSCGAKLDDDRMTYMNKGQYYTLIMENHLPPAALRSSFVKSVISLRFRDEHNPDAATKYWNFWHTRQTDVEEARGIDLDIKNSEGIIDDTLEHVGINALTFAWDPHEPVKAQIAVHCLSTDFSNQKGVKGLPLHIQVDTYDDIYMTTKCPINRSYAQIKIFCDKGAERKARDEEKKKEKASKPTETPGPKISLESYHPIEEHTEFYTMADLTTDILVYNPPQPHTHHDMFDDLPLKELVTSADPTMSSDTLPSFLDADILMPSNPKRIRLCDSTGILVYVREAHESVFTALLISSATTQGLCNAIREKFPKIADIRMVYKRTSRGILVKLDDNMVKHFIHESMYMLDFKQYSDEGCDITLIETDL